MLVFCFSLLLGREGVISMAGLVDTLKFLVGSGVVVLLSYVDHNITSILSQTYAVETVPLWS